MMNYDGDIKDLDGKCNSLRTHITKLWVASILLTLWNLLLVGILVTLRPSAVYEPPPPPPELRAGDMVQHKVFPHWTGVIAAINSDSKTANIRYTDTYSDCREKASHIIEWKRHD